MKETKLDAALATIADYLHRKIQPGEITGTIVDNAGELEIEVTLRISRRVSPSNEKRYRAHAMALLAIEPWRDRCPKTVKNRGSWAVTKHKGCDNKVSTVVVCSGYEDEVGPLRPGEHRRMIRAERYHFVCSHHTEGAGGSDVLAVVALDKAALRAIRAQRERESAELAAREQAKERELEAEIRALSDDDLARRMHEFMATHRYGASDACHREQRRREQAKGAR